MAPKLTAEELRGCYACHSTGYGQGRALWTISPRRILRMWAVKPATVRERRMPKVVSPAAIRRTPRHEDCLACHNESRVKAFNFKPLIHSGAH